MEYLFPIHIPYIDLFGGSPYIHKPSGGILNLFHHTKKHSKNCDDNTPIPAAKTSAWWYTTTPLKNMSWDDDIPNIWEKTNVPNYQPVIYIYI